MKRLQRSGWHAAWRRPTTKDPASTRLLAGLVAALATWVAATAGLLLTDMSWRMIVHGGGSSLFIYLGMFFMAFGWPCYGATLFVMRRCRRA